MRDLGAMLPGSTSVFSIVVLTFISRTSLPVSRSTVHNINGNAILPERTSKSVEAGWRHPKSMDENFWLVHGDKNGETHP